MTGPIGSGCRSRALEELDPFAGRQFDPELVRLMIDLIRGHDAYRGSRPDPPPGPQTVPTETAPDGGAASCSLHAHRRAKDRLGGRARVDAAHWHLGPPTCLCRDRTTVAQVGERRQLADHVSCCAGRPSRGLSAGLADRQDPCPAFRRRGFVTEGAALRVWPLIESPTPFRMRRIFMGFERRRPRLRSGRLPAAARTGRRRRRPRAKLVRSPRYPAGP